MFKRIRPAVLATAAATILVLPLSACADAPGQHPRYLHALSDMRMARWLLEHQAGDSKVYAEADFSISEIDAAIHEIERAAMDDGKHLRDTPSRDVDAQGSRLWRAIVALKQARADIEGGEDNPDAREFRYRAREHLDRAIHAAEKAHNEWLRDVRR